MVLEAGAVPAVAEAKRGVSPAKPDKEDEEQVSKEEESGSLLLVCHAEVRSVPGKGMGLFATRDLQPGAVVARERPMLVMPDRIFQMEDMDRIEAWMDRAVNKLSSEHRRDFFDLSDSRSAAAEDSDKTALGIFFTNDMNYCGDAALFPTLARANHACDPNCDFVARPELGAQDIVAVRAVRAGEEVTLCYLPAADEGTDGADVRQAYIREWYGFRCTCAVCTMSDAALEENEAVRRMIKSVQERGFGAVSLTELERFFGGLAAVGCKVPYQLEVAAAVFERATGEGDLALAARAFAAGYIMDDVVGSEGDKANAWDHVLGRQLVEIGGSLHIF